MTYVPEPVTVAKRSEHKLGGVITAMGSVMFATLVVSLLAFGREALVAAYLGLNRQVDAYFFTLALILLVPQFVSTAIAESLIPIYVHYKEKGATAVYRFISSVLNLYLLFLAGTTALTAATARFFVPSLGSGFDAPAQQLILQMFWILLPIIILNGLWGLSTTILYAEGLFFISTISRAFQSVGVVGLVLLAGRQLGVYSLVIGIELASFGQLAWTGYWLYRKGVRYGFVLDIGDPGLWRFLVLLWPCLVASFLAYCIPIIDRSMASHLPEGTISALSYADRLMSMIGGISIFSINTVLLPYFSKQSAGTDRDGFKRSISRTLGMLMFMLIPLSLMLVTVRVPLIKVLFQRGKFDAVATANTAAIFGGYALGLLPKAIAITLSTAFNALEDTKTQSFFGGGSNVVSKLVYNHILIAIFGATGVALATVLMHITSGAILLYILRRRLRGIGGRGLLETFSKVLVASLLAIGVMHLVVTHEQIPAIAVVAISMASGSVSYLLFSALLKVPQLTLASVHILSMPFLQRMRS